jgi:hypothetical protein
MMYLTVLANFDNIPLMIEHLNSSEDYALAAEHIRNIGKENNLVI